MASANILEDPLTGHATAAIAQGPTWDMLQSWLAKLRLNMQAASSSDKSLGISDYSFLLEQQRQQQQLLNQQNQQSQRLLQHKAMQQAQQDAAGANSLLPPLPHGEVPRKTLVLDLDHTLIDCMLLSDASGEPDFIYTDCEGSRAKVWLRPYLLEFLRAVRQDFEVVLFTAAGQRHADAVLSVIDPENQLFDHRLYAQHTVCAPEWAYVKDLSRLGRDLAHTLIIDDCAAAALHQPANWVSISPFRNNVPGASMDASLRLILQFLQDKVLPAEDVRVAISQHYNVPACCPQRAPAYMQLGLAAEAVQKGNSADTCVAAASTTAGKGRFSVAVYAAQDDEEGEEMAATQRDVAVKGPVNCLKATATLPSSFLVAPLLSSTAPASQAALNSDADKVDSAACHHTSAGSYLNHQVSVGASDGYLSTGLYSSDADSDGYLSGQPFNSASQVYQGRRSTGNFYASGSTPYALRTSSSCGGTFGRPNTLSSSNNGGTFGGSSALDALVQAPRGLRRVPTVLDDLVTMRSTEAMMGHVATSTIGGLQAPDGIVVVPPATPPPAAPPPLATSQRPPRSASRALPQELDSPFGSLDEQRHLADVLAKSAITKGARRLSQADTASSDVAHVLCSNKVLDVQESDLFSFEGVDTLRLGSSCRQQSTPQSLHMALTPAAKRRPSALQSVALPLLLSPAAAHPGSGAGTGVEVPPTPPGPLPEPLADLCGLDTQDTWGTDVDTTVSRTSSDVLQLRPEDGTASALLERIHKLNPPVVLLSGACTGVAAPPVLGSIDQLAVPLTPANVDKPGAGARHGLATVAGFKVQPVAEDDSFLAGLAPVAVMPSGRYGRMATAELPDVHTPADEDATAVYPGARCTPRSTASSACSSRHRRSCSASAMLVGLPFALLPGCSKALVKVNGLM